MLEGERFLLPRQREFNRRHPEERRVQAHAELLRCGGDPRIVRRGDEGVHEDFDLLLMHPRELFARVVQPIDEVVHLELQHTAARCFAPAANGRIQELAQRGEHSELRLRDPRNCAPPRLRR